jgi:hypothetical protein
MPRHVVAPVDGCGFGCVLTSLALVRALPAPWFAFEHFSEDFDFCLKAKAAGDLPDGAKKTGDDTPKPADPKSEVVKKVGA